MDKPMCRICSNRHNSSEPHIWEDEPKRKVQPAAKVGSVSRAVAKSAVQKSVDAAMNTMIESVVTSANPICRICGDKAHHDYLAAEKEKWKLKKRKQRSKK